MNISICEADGVYGWSGKSFWLRFAECKAKTADQNATKNETLKLGEKRKMGKISRKKRIGF